MNPTEQIKILLSKSKLIKMLFCSIAFVAAGLWFIISPPKIENSLFYYPMLVTTTGIAAILFFGLCAFVISNKLKDNSAGLIIDRTGITDNASGISAGHIPWNDIRGISTSQVMGQRFIIILVDNPTDYIKRQTTAIKRKFAEMNYKKYGSPISISSNALKCDFEELESILYTQCDKNKI